MTNPFNETVRLQPIRVDFSLADPFAVYEKARQIAADLCAVLPSVDIIQLQNAGYTLSFAWIHGETVFESATNLKTVGILHEGLLHLRQQQRMENTVRFDALTYPLTE